MQNWVRQGYSEGAQLSVYVHNEERVNLFARDDRKNPKFNQNSITSIFSSTKNFAALLMAIAVQNGWIDSYDDPVSKYWPEFPSTRLVLPFEEYITFHDTFCVDDSNKDQCTKTNLRSWCNARNIGSFREDFTPKIKDVLRHEAGFGINLNQEETQMNSTTPSEWKRIVEDQEYMIHFEESTRTYHALTRGYILDPIFKNVEPKGRSMTEYFNEEIAPKVSSDDDKFKFFLRFDGLQNDKEAIDRMYHINQPPTYWFLYHVFFPIYTGFTKPFTDMFGKQLCPSYMGVMDEALCPEETLNGIAHFIKTTGKFPQSNFVDVDTTAGPKSLSKQYEGKIAAPIMSASGIGSAHSVAKAASYMMFSGKVLRKEQVEAMLSERVDRKDMMLNWATSFSAGGFHHWDIQGLHWYGWGGWGGSIFVFNLEHECVITFLPTAFNSPHYTHFQIPRPLVIMNLVTQQLISDSE